jgi:hypothetical protein
VFSSKHPEISCHACMHDAISSIAHIHRTQAQNKRGRPVRSSVTVRVKTRAFAGRACPSSLGPSRSPVLFKNLTRSSACITKVRQSSAKRNRLDVPVVTTRRTRNEGSASVCSLTFERFIYLGKDSLSLSRLFIRRSPLQNFDPSTD